MAGMPDKQNVATVVDQPLRLAVHLGDERAGGVDIVEPARFGDRRHDLRHAMGGEHHGPAVGHFVQFLDEDRAQPTQPVYDEAVVDDFVPDIDRRPEPLDRQFDDLDGAVDAGAESARRGDQQLEMGAGGHAGAM